MIGKAFKISVYSNRIIAQIMKLRLLEPMLGPIVAALLTLIILIPATSYFISHNLPLTIRNESDIRAYMSMRLLAARDGRPAIYNLGGSSLLRAVDEDAGLERRFDYRFDIFNLTNPSQSMIESWLLLHKVDLRPSDLVVMHVNISRLNNVEPLEHWMCSPYFYSINPDDIASAMDDLGLSAEINPLCQITWLSRRAIIKNMVRNIRKGSPVYQGIYPLPVDHDPEALKEMRENRLAKQKDPEFADSWLKLDKDAARVNVNLILRMQKYVTSKGAEFVLLDPPMNRDWFERYHDQWFPFESEYRQVLEPVYKAGIDYRDLRAAEGFNFEDYYDQAHFIEQGREKFFPIYKSIVFQKLGAQEKQ